MIKLHYIYDPLCGWCYGASPLIELAVNHQGVELILQGGGMLAGDNRLLMNEQFRQHIMLSDQRIAAMTGQYFGDDYHSMLAESGLVFDSAPPITAILTAQQLSGQGFPLLKAIQHAHYVEGRHISDKEVLFAIAKQIDLDNQTFATQYALNADLATQQHIEQSRNILAKSGASGFPTLLIEQQGKLNRVPLQNYLGRQDEWLAYLDQLTTQLS
nr:DsbA family protein [uncultured Moellerella sp.]